MIRFPIGETVGTSAQNYVRGTPSGRGTAANELARLKATFTITWEPRMKQRPKNGKVRFLVIPKIGRRVYAKISDLQLEANREIEFTAGYKTRESRLKREIEHGSDESLLPFFVATDQNRISEEWLVRKYEKAVVGSQHACATGELIVASPTGKVLPYRFYLKAVKTYCEELGITVLGTHGLRHSTSELYMSHGATRDDLRSLFAHSKLRSAIYTAKIRILSESPT